MRTRLVILAALACLCPVLGIGAPAAAAPRLLMSYPKDGFYGAGPWEIALVFSEPMDPSSIVLPNLDASNPDRSFEFLDLMPPGRWVPHGMPPARPIAREGGLMIEIPKAGFVADYGAQLRLFRNGFRSVTGQSLDRDYTIRFASTTLPWTDWDILRVSVPADGAATMDGRRPLSIYLGMPVDPNAQFEADLRGGLGDQDIPLEYSWDMPGTFVSNVPAPTHLMVMHEQLFSSPRAYVFQTRKVYGPQGLHWPNFAIRFTVGPAVAGDLNGNGVVDVGDVVLALRAAMGFITLTPAQQFAADLWPPQGANGRDIGDGVVDVNDALYILQRAIGLTDDEHWP